MTRKTTDYFLDNLELDFLLETFAFSLNYQSLCPLFYFYKKGIIQSIVKFGISLKEFIR
jgi:hypothetical protein